MIVLYGKGSNGKTTLLCQIKKIIEESTKNVVRFVQNYKYLDSYLPMYYVAEEEGYTIETETSIKSILSCEQYYSFIPFKKTCIECPEGKKPSIIACTNNLDNFYGNSSVLESLSIIIHITHRF